MNKTVNLIKNIYCFLFHKKYGVRGWGTCLKCNCMRSGIRKWQWKFNPRNKFNE